MGLEGGYLDMCLLDQHCMKLSKFAAGLCVSIILFTLYTVWHKLLGQSKGSPDWSGIILAVHYMILGSTVWAHLMLINKLYRTH